MPGRLWADFRSGLVSGRGRRWGAAAGDRHDSGARFASDAEVVGGDRRFRRRLQLGPAGLFRHSMKGMLTASVKPLTIMSTPRTLKIPLPMRSVPILSTMAAEASTTAICRNAWA